VGEKDPDTLWPHARIFEKAVPRKEEGRKITPHHREPRGGINVAKLAPHILTNE